ncbi:Hypothetical protein FKW44_008480 [Caligus rogercresseyi]|uniref:Uncharacterized protein n=1 Tax=Caligus rogercresseyi TaxID=217165 RepID=A0A7T8KG52_CALRO|nr:Hypothetical protein FKW44_008480 [Caligus rogercresseyi]
MRSKDSFLNVINLSSNAILRFFKLKYSDVSFANERNRLRKKSRLRILFGSRFFFLLQYLVVSPPCRCACAECKCHTRVSPLPLSLSSPLPLSLSPSLSFF